jgi:hypothetical protein
MALFAEQAKDVDIIITTAMIPGKPAPKLITEFYEYGPNDAGNAICINMAFVGLCSTGLRE